MFEWDEAKAARNLAKHGVDFALVAEFEFALATVSEDRRRDYGERRFRATGPIGQRLHVLLYVLRGDAIRVISLRRANRREVRRWQVEQGLTR